MKNELRKNALEKRKLLDTEELSKSIMSNLFRVEEYKKSQNILCYYPLKYEVSDILCVEDTNKNVYLPKVCGTELNICPYDKTKMTKGSYNIMEPQTLPITDYNIIDLVIVPALCADQYGYRIGYGKGYYDRLLKKIPNKCIKVILCFSDFFYDSVFPNNLDEKANIIITEKGIYKA